MVNRFRDSVAVAALAAAAAVPASAQTYNLYGAPGLIDMPTAESLPDAQVGLSLGFLGETQRTGVGFQITPGVHGTLRVGTIQDDPSGTELSFEGFDLQFRLIEENGMLPAIALGLRDFLGDGPYGAEYLVATKTVAPGLKLSGGIGWGRLGSSDGFDNPIGGNVRGGPTTPSGQPQWDSYFTGEAAFFGGLEWATPVDGLTLKAEYSSDAYAPEVAGGFERDSSFNFGLTYAPNENVQLSGYYLYGSTLGVQLSLTGNPFDPQAPQDLGTAPAPVRARPDDAPRGTAWARSTENRDRIIAAAAKVLEADGILIDQARIAGDEIEIHIENTLIQREPKAIGRTARVLALVAPPSVETFRITPVVGDLPVNTVVIRRSDLEAQVDQPDAGMLSWQTTELENARASILGDDVFLAPEGPRFSWSFNPSLPVNLLDTDDGLQLDLLLSAQASYRLAPGLSVTGEVSRFLVGTDQKTVSTSTSTLPRVRSDSDLYWSGRDFDLNRLTLDWVAKPHEAIYTRLSAGLLERMFAGVSGEVLYAPANSDFAYGAELNYARQRDFEGAFDLIDYDVVTGHGSVYWDTGFRGIEAQLDVGRYLAGDYGATVSLARRFANGWDVRGYATLTEVGFDEYGDGSFTKGFEVTIPLGWTLPFETKSESRVELLQVDGDGGARLDIRGRLYDRIRDLDRRSLEDGWSAFWQ
ncbi:YjbH domain-containing protein [Halovulum dunhuangense]|uniref:YjbH domain-containing protein n=1 Tax=Halovulum dunhuangense TaxID=1505036 RepID=A0A849KVH4_9RHOB|nr:YjbH domain-containing protein [Halovulum dunhuangense]NNU79398.1 YjbH domain-containing protein [Halovulum dunhuangense]